MHSANTDAISDSLEFCLALAKAASALTRRFDGRLGMFHGIGLSDFLVLLEMSRAPEGRLRRVDLAARLGLTPSAVTRTLIPLERIGLVTRQRDPHDARAGYAVLTKAGQRVLKESLVSAEELAEDALPSIPGAQLEKLSAVLSGLVGGGSVGRVAEAGA